MLTHKDFLTICYKAKRHAQMFLKDQDDAYAMTPGQFLHDPRLAFQAAEDFVLNYVGIPVIYTSLPPNYASWLVADATRSMSIAINQDQLRAWHRHTGKDCNNQRLLCLLHEFAHSQITPRLMRGTTASASPTEEERAWVYAYAFMTTICGHYSFDARRNQNVDDVAKFVI